VHVIKAGANPEEDEIEIAEFRKIMRGGIKALHDILESLESDDWVALEHFGLCDDRLKKAQEAIDYYVLRVSEHYHD